MNQRTGIHCILLFIPCLSFSTTAGEPDQATPLSSFWAKEIPEDIQIKGSCRSAIQSLMSVLMVDFTIEDVFVPIAKKSLFSQEIEIDLKKGTTIRDALLDITKKLNGFSIFTSRGKLHFIANQLSASNPADEVVENYTKSGNLDDLITEVISMHTGVVLGGLKASSPIGFSEIKSELALKGKHTIREVLNELFCGTGFSYDLIYFPRDSEVPNDGGFPFPVEFSKQLFSMQLSIRKFNFSRP